MSRGPYRLAQGGSGIDRETPLPFTWNGRPRSGYQGDTLASALLANGHRVVARSFKYHRPRGIYTIGSEEPGGLVTTGTGARQDPNLKAPTVPLHRGLVARAQNCWPSPRFDLMSINGLAAPLFVAGFYYKTFMRPASWWEPVYERVIRRAAGLGRVTTEPDPDTYLRAEAHCDVLVVGAGAAGLEAARTAARSGARVMLVEERAWLGGRLAMESGQVGEMSAMDWVQRAEEELDAADRVTVLRQTVAFGVYDHRIVGLLETLAPASSDGAARQRSWTIKAGQIVFATGALEQPLAFAGNDRPGVMLANAARGYAHRFGVAIGERVVIASGDEEGPDTALALQRVGVNVVAVVDSRGADQASGAERLAQAGIRHIPAAVITRADGRQQVRGVRVAALSDATVETGQVERIGCDAVAVAGGWQPALHLQCHLGGRPGFDESRGIFLPPAMPEGYHNAGACAGEAGLDAARQSGRDAGARAARAMGHEPAVKPLRAAMAGAADASWGPVDRPRVIPAVHGGKRFIDLQHDVTVDDVALAHREGYRSVEHLKRYTTLGMGTDQGKTANILGLHALGQVAGVGPGEAGTTTFRPPYVPITIGAIAGADRGRYFRPWRRSPAEPWHRQAGADMIPAGAWHRPRAYPRADEALSDAVRREAAHVREAAGIVDVSTLGKIALVGPDAPEVVNRLYVNGMKTLPPGKARYGLMLRDDGLVLDDGTVARLEASRYLITTTTAHAAGVLSHIEYLLETAWIDLRAAVASVSDHWATFAIAGPNSQAVLAELFPATDTSDAEVPFLAVRSAQCNGVDCMIMRNSYSGERAYEVYVPADWGASLWAHALEVGAPHGLRPYGTEAMGVLRIEKGHVAGPELDGRVTAEDLGLGRMTARRKPCVGGTLRDRPGLHDDTRPRLVGLTPVDARAPLRSGALLRAVGREGSDAVVGHVSSVADSPACDSMIALGMLSGGDERHGEIIEAWDPLSASALPVRVGPTVFFDPEGRRLHA